LASLTSRRNALLVHLERKQTKNKHHFNGIFSRTIWISWFQKGKAILDFTMARDGGLWRWQWHRLDRMQTICTSLQTDNHDNTSSLYFTSQILFLTPDVCIFKSLQALTALVLTNTEKCQDKYHILTPAMENSITRENHSLASIQLSSSFGFWNPQLCPELSKALNSNYYFFIYLIIHLKAKTNCSMTSLNQNEMNVPVRKPATGCNW